MKEDTPLVQCTLERQESDCTHTLVVWLEASKVGLEKQVLVSDIYDKKADRVWWTVKKVGTEKIPYGKLADKNRTYIWDVKVNQLRGNK